MITAAKVFSDYMVLQRDEILSVWGFADEIDNNKTVTVEFKGAAAKATVKNGRWCAKFDSAFGVCTTEDIMTVTTEYGTKTFEHVLVGDVYLVIGQSNIRYNVSAIINGAPEGYPGKDFKITDNDQIRLNRSSIHDADTEAGGTEEGSFDSIINADLNGIYPARGTEDVIEDIRTGRRWSLPSEDGLEFSAIGMFTATINYRALGKNIPIGVIEIDADGQSLMAFYPNDFAEKYDLDWVEDGVHKAILLGGEHSPSRFVFNQLIAPFVGYGVCALIWYQGESDFNEQNAPVFAQHYQMLIDDYRSKWNLERHHDFPVYMVEIPTCYYIPNGWPEGELWAYIDMGVIRGEMGNVPNLLKNSYIAASSDLWLDAGYWNSLHPYCKWPQSERLSKMMLATIYKTGDIESSAGAQLCSVEYNGASAKVKMRYVAEGLTTASSSDVLGFEVLCDGEWTSPESVLISGKDEIEITAKNNIDGVRYNCITDNFFPDKCNLCSGSTIPAIAFQTTK